MRSLRVRALDEGDLPVLLGLQHAGAGSHDRWSAAELSGQLHDAGRGHGRQVVVAARGDAVAGCAGWVEAAPWCFGAPVLAADDEAAAALVAHVVARARAIAATQLRISAMPGEVAKQGALAAAGFAAMFDFVTVIRPVAPGDGTRWSRPWRRVGWSELDAGAFAAVNNDTFDGVPNSVPATVAEIREQLDAPLIDRGATAAWADGDDGYLAFVQVERDRDARGPSATIASIGVRSAARGQGAAGAILDDVIARVALEVGEVRALIASTNTPSLRLHAGRGFVERARRTVYQLDLTPTRA